jgi:hypothetical protein
MDVDRIGHAGPRAGLSGRISLSWHDTEWTNDDNDDDDTESSCQTRYLCEGAIKMRVVPRQADTVRPA